MHSAVLVFFCIFIFQTQGHALISKAVRDFLTMGHTGFEDIISVPDICTKILENKAIGHYSISDQIGLVVPPIKEALDQWCAEKTTWFEGVAGYGQTNFFECDGQNVDFLSSFLSTPDLDSQFFHNIADYANPLLNFTHYLTFCPKNSERKLVTPAMNYTEAITYLIDSCNTPKLKETYQNLLQTQDTSQEQQDILISLAFWLKRSLNSDFAKKTNTLLQQSFTDTSLPGFFVRIFASIVGIFRLNVPLPNVDWYFYFKSPLVEHTVFFQPTFSP